MLAYAAPQQPVQEALAFNHSFCLELRTNLTTLQLIHHFGFAWLLFLSVDRKPVSGALTHVAHALGAAACGKGGKRDVFLL